MVITGASMGIGEAIAKLFADEGASMVLLSRDAGRAEAARGRIGHVENTLALSCDVRNREEIDRVVSLTLHHFQRIDIWINNAGHGLMDARRTRGYGRLPRNLRHQFLRDRRLHAGRSGGDEAAGFGSDYQYFERRGSHSASVSRRLQRHQIRHECFRQSSQRGTQRLGINVTTVCPGYVRTDFSANAIKGSEAKTVRPSSVRGISAERVARAVLHGYLKRKREVVVPWTMHPAIKVYQLFPGLVERTMVKMSRRVD